METSTLHQIKRKASQLFEHRLLQAGTVLAVRQWQPATIIEIDLHLPFAHMEHWNEIPYIKCKVADFVYRDYTPSGWDVETHTCTLYIDAAHHGPGSQWASQLKPGDTVHYLKISSTHHGPVGNAMVIGLGDESSLGHLLALQQTVSPSGHFSGAILLTNKNHQKLFSEYFHSPLQAISRNERPGHEVLFEWLLKQNYPLEQSVFYLAGNQSMVIQLRKILRQRGYASSQIKAQGFWS
jgi:NADPH-dependent ferric siderophore reductase